MGFRLVTRRSLSCVALLSRHLPEPQFPPITTTECGRAGRRRPSTQRSPPERGSSAVGR